MLMSQNESDEPDIIRQRMERSMDFWIDDREDYPPSIRGAVAEISDLPSELRELIQSVAGDERYPELELKRVLWFEDKNDKLDQACTESKAAFRPYSVNADGLVVARDPNNTTMKAPTHHRLIVSDDFAATNYERPSDDLLADDNERDSPNKEGLSPSSWKRKIAQTLKPWSIAVDGLVQHARPEDDLLTTLNCLFSRTKHGWLVVDVCKLRERRGAILSYARTFEYQRKVDQAFEFLVQLFGTAEHLRKRLGKPLSRVAYLCAEIAEDGEVYVTKTSIYQDEQKSDDLGVSEVAIPIETEVVLEKGQPGQLRIRKAGKYYESKIAPAIEPGKRKTLRIDLRKSNSAGKRFKFDLRVEMNAPLLVASSGNAMIFDLDDMLNRFMKTSLTEIRQLAQDVE